MKKTARRALALLLCLVMCLGMLPAGIVSAAEPEQVAIPIYEDTSYSFAERAADLVARMTLSQKASQLVEGAAAIPASQLGGGALHTTATKGLARYSWWAEALHGLLRDNMSPQSEGTKDNVSYAQSLTMASTWNPDLYYEGATAIADECRERSITNELGNALNINFYSPTVNMQRDPRWGRNEESYSEDVYLTSVMGTAFVNGMEGKDREGNVIDPSGYKKTLTTIKHYTANNTEAIRTNGGATSDLRALREYFTAPYRNVIKGADVASVMTAYSSFNSEPCSYSSYLMDTLLRQTFGFSGHITSDCDSAKTISNLNYTNPRTGKKLTAVEQMAGALAHGEDLECNSGISASVGDYKSQASDMVSGNVQTDKGTFTENSIDVSLLRLMTARISTGELDENNPYTIAANTRKADQKANGTNNYTPERIAIVDREVEEGVVMLKNDGILPLSIPASGAYNVAIIGSWQTDMYLGLYSSEQRHAEDDKWRINIQKGITNAIKEVNPDAAFTYITSNSLTAANEEAIRAADVAIVVTGTGSSYSAEGRDRSSTALPNNQATLISNVGKLNANTVAVMETCGPMEVKTFENDVKAILWSSFGGIRKGVGFGKVLTGAVNPSGHLTSTWYKNDSDIPGIRDYNLYATNGSNGRTYMYYVGENEPSYVFGYGLSYTTFEYSDLIIDKTAYDANDTVKVSFDVKNTGDVAGKEVTQLYIAQPDAPKELNRPIRRLEGFQKVELQPGETKTVTMEVAIPDLVYYDEATDCYAVDTGAYQVQVGEDSAHADLTADFTVSGEMDVYPELLTVKANQVGDDALGIEERVIFDKGAIINPQLTVAMNNEKLYGYIIKEQTSIIKSLESCPLPEGMSVSYESNRPSVASVTDGVIKAVAPGVATITATAELDGHIVTDDFVVYVMVNSKLDSIEVNGEPIAKFKDDKYSYKMTLEANAQMPVVTAKGKAGMEVKVEMPETLPGIATITSIDPESGLGETYTIEFKVKATNSHYMLADEIEAGKSYVIVYGDSYAMTYGDNITATEVEVKDDMLVSDVTDEMLWTFNEGTCSRAGEYTGYYLTCGDSGVLSRSSSKVVTNAYTLENIIGNSRDYYAYWIPQDLDIDGNKGLFLVSSYGSNRYALQGSATGFTTKSGSNLDSLLAGAPLKFYEYVAGLPNIDFTNSADASKFDVVNEKNAAIEDGKGLTLTATRPAFEPCNGQNSGSQATTPEDVIVVPVNGDWTATLEFDFSTGSARNGYYQFFGFYASEGGDFQNMAGIRGGDGAMQNFLRVDGNITADSSNLNSKPGLASNGTYWYQIAKKGDTYTCLRSSDGDDFTEMFTYDATGIEADSIVIDAYTGMTEGYKFTLKSLNFEGGITKKEKPEIASITVNGEDFGFNKDTKIYNFEVAKDSTAIPVIEATAANKSTQITIDQLDGPFGTAYVTANVDKKAITYSLSFNYGPQDDYFADGDMSDNWTILHEVKDPTPERPWTYYRFEEGTGLVMPTQKGSIYMAKQADPQGPWTNMFTMPAQGNWEVIIKSFYPQLPKDIYQQTQVLAWQDEDHYIRINCQYNKQQNLRVEPANEVGSGTFNILDVTYANPNPDNTATLYYKINKNGTTYTVSYSTDCKNWVAGGSVSGLDYVDPKIGIFCTQDDGNNNYIELAFEYVAVTSLNGVEQKNGIEVLNWAAQNVADYIAAGLPAEAAEQLSYKAPHGYEVAFESSNADVIAADGTITPAAADTEVQVTVKVTEGDIVASSEPVTILVKGTGEEGDVEVVIDDPTIPIYENPQYTFAERAADLLARMSLSQKGSMLVENSPAILAENLTGGTLNVPATQDLSHYCWWSEALHGFLRDNEQPQTDGSRDNVSYVQSMTIASTWNPELYYEGAVEIANEIRERAVKNELGNCINLEFYSPTINMQRDPRWGRNEESYSEDPLLVATMASQFVLGMEGKDQNGNIIDPSGYKKTLTTIKHYVANNTEAIRQSGGAVSDLRALREYFAAPYREVIQATNVSSVMTAYSSFNEEPCSYSSYLMDTLLRQTFGFTGFITSDCDSVSTMSNLSFINPRTGAKLTQVEQWGGALAHGEDLECNSGGRTDYRKMAKTIVESNLQTDMGTFTENTIDVSAHRLLTARISTGELDANNPYTIAANERKADQEARGLNNYTPERIDIVDRQAREGVVLLKNENNLLPLQIPAEGDDYNIVIIGNWAHQENDKGDRNHKFYLGLYSSEQRFEQDDKWRIDIQTGINTAVHAINPNITPTYLMKDTVDAADEEILKAADAVIVVVGTNNSYAAEGRDRSSIALPNGLDTFISNVGKLNKNTIAVMETCGPMQVTKFENDVAAILWSSFGGIRKGTGFGEVITGATNPSGHLTSTWHQNDSDMPGIRDYNLYATNGNHGRTYMYYDNWVPVSYPFGYGLSYTTFAYSNLSIDKTAYDANDTVKVSFDVTNTGKVAGKEVAQLYIAQPEAPAEMLRPIRRLEGFKKIDLEPGETKTVELEVKIPDLAYYYEEDDCFKVDTGLYQVQVGEDSASANLTTNFTVSGEMDEYPVVLNVKANQVGDEALGIESRIIFDKGATINPQLTVAMNNEKLYGYIIADQQDLVKSLKSCPLPEGMTFEYHSNRPSVAKVTADGIKAVAPGVATITVIGEMNGHTVTTDFVVYVEANAEVDSITVDGKPIEGFARDQFTYELDYSGEGLPVIEAISANDDLEITVNQLTKLPGVAEVVSVSKSTGTTCVYRIGAGPAPVSTDFAEGWAAAQAKNWTSINANENAVFGENGLTITTEQGAIGADAKNLYLEPGFGQWVAQTHFTLDAAIAQDGPAAGMVVYDDNSNYIRYVIEQVTTSSWGRTTTSRVLRAYSVSNGEETQVASVTLSTAPTEMFLQIVKRNKTYSFRYSLNGTDWVDVSGTTALKMAYPRLGVYTSGGTVEGLNPIAVTFDGINVFKVGDLYPRLASITADGEQIGGFDPECFVYNFALDRDGKTAPVIAATPADPEHTVTVDQIDGDTGMAVITVASGAANQQYKIGYNYRPESEYFADGKLSSDWAILNEDAEGYAVEKGAGVVLPTQYGDIRAADAYTESWKNLFVAPAMGNAWEVVAKVVFPVAPKANTQMNQFLIFQDDANYVFAGIQNPLKVTYGSETNDTYTSNNSGWFFSGPNAVAAEDGSLTVYFSIKNKGDSYTLAWSQDGRTFQSLGTVSGVNLANPMIGLFATERSTAEPIDVQYEYVAVTSLDTVELMNYSQMLSWAAGNVAEYVAADVPAETAENIVFDAIPHGYTMEVISSDPDVIAADGTVTPAAQDKVVALTIKISEGDVVAESTVNVKVPGNAPVESPFEDVDADAYYFDAVVWAAENGITNGFEPGLFAPNNDVTRAQIVTMLWRAAGCPIVETAAGFKDVKANAYYYDAIAWAVSEGITNGVGKNMFAPNDICTRGQIVTFLWRYMGKPAAEAAAEFVDVPADEYYADAVAWAVEAKVAEGYPEGIFKPMNDCTRAQAVTFLQRTIAE